MARDYVVVSKYRIWYVCVIMAAELNCDTDFICTLFTSAMISEVCIQDNLWDMWCDSVRMIKQHCLLCSVVLLQGFYSCFSSSCNHQN